MIDHAEHNQHATTTIGDSPSSTTFRDNSPDGAFNVKSNVKLL
jgi:hypothetical protein